MVLFIGILPARLSVPVNPYYVWFMRQKWQYKSHGKENITPSTPCPAEPRFVLFKTIVDPDQLVVNRTI